LEVLAGAHKTASFSPQLHRHTRPSPARQEGQTSVIIVGGASLSRVR
jgi:hypothetical protein